MKLNLSTALTAAICLSFMITGCASDSVGIKEKTMPAEQTHEKAAEQTADQTAEQTTDKPIPAAAKTTGTNTLTGTYFANLPCKNCRGIRVNIAFNADNSYEKIVETLGSNTEPAYENGQWQLLSNRLTLSSSKAVQTPLPVKQFAVEGAHLRLLDNHGKPYTGKDKDRYLFEKPK
ncbi:MAG: hypothetical protein CSA44_02555 [Gammaproteobacteria bacterium]|nr:MAG: hypothetical protein CSA44_02555 [Gammaproteobacteria bacterium]